MLHWQRLHREDGALPPALNLSKHSGELLQATAWRALSYAPVAWAEAVRTAVLQVLDGRIVEAESVLQELVSLNEVRREPLSLLVEAETSTEFTVDSVNKEILPPDGSTIVVNSVAGDVITIKGWAVDTAAQRAAGGVFINIDGQADVAAVRGLPRPDVGAWFKNPSFNNAGFQARLSAKGLGTGRHVLTVKILTTDRSSYYWPDYRMILDVR